MTTDLTQLIDIDTFMRRAIEKRPKPSFSRCLRSERRAAAFARQCGARIITGGFWAPGYSLNHDVILLPHSVLRAPKWPAYSASTLLPSA